MPIYEYQCKKCEKVFEITQKITETPKKKCPECSGKLDKLMSAPSFHLKGSGWYVTDFAGKGKKADAKSEGKSETKAEAKPEVKTETKTESKSEKKPETKSEKPKPKAVSE